MYLLGTAAAPYYYVIVLVQLYVLSPLLAPLARKHWKLLLIVTGVLKISAVIAVKFAQLRLNLGWADPALDVLRDWHLFEFVFWFALGMVLGYHQPELRAFFEGRRWILHASLIVSMVIGIIEWEVFRNLSGKEWITVQSALFNRVFVLLLLIIYLVYDSVHVPFKSTLEKLGAKSYGIYLAHIIPLEIAARGLYHFAPKLLAYQIITLPLITPAGIIVPLCLMLIFERSFLRPAYKWVFG